jgi:hypothetical protein
MVRDEPSPSERQNMTSAANPAAIATPAATPLPEIRGLAGALIGRAFVSPAVDILLIGGGLSLLATLVIVLVPGIARPADAGLMAWVILLSNSAHFAASSTRLYARPGVSRAMPWLAIALPFVFAGVFAVGLAWPTSLAPALETLYLTWSPYHYAAQAYGIAIYYAHRAGVRTSGADRNALYYVALIPFLYMLARGITKHFPASAGPLPSSAHPFGGIGGLLAMTGLLAPLVLYAHVWRRDGRPLPLLSLLPLVSNGVWFFVLDPLDAFLWATIFHGLQYLVLVLAFHASARRAAQPATAPAPGVLGPVLGFYLVSVALGYTLFVLVPAAGVALGGSYVDSRLLAVSLVNIHHFIVDARIWRLRGGDANRRIVEAVA